MTNAPAAVAWEQFSSSLVWRTSMSWFAWMLPKAVA
jgi:hypothetical protein